MIILKKGTINNLLILFCSCLLSLLSINTVWLFYITRFDQKDGFPRKFLKYIPPPTSSWNYPDLNNNYPNQLNQFLIIGDSYAEGAGDAFLNNQYNYSASHFLNQEGKYSILLSANSGSSIPSQLKKLENSFQNILLPNKVNKYLDRDNINLMAFFYEGNDLEHLIILKNYDNQYSDKNERIKRYLNKNFPLIKLIQISTSKIKQKLKSHNRKLSKIKFDQNSTRQVEICRNNKCRVFNPIQSAAPELTTIQLDNTISETVQSLVNFKEKYNANICFIYIPSIATIYSPESIYYQEYLGTGKGMITSKENRERSDYIRKRFSSSLNIEEITFYDSTNFLKKFSDKEFIHGIKDPKHFNQKGYKLLADYLSPKISHCLKKNK